MASARVKTSLAAMAVIGCVLIASVWAGTLIEIEIEISPRTLNLQNQGEVVTVHTDIAYGAVVSTEVYLNGIQIDWSKADNQGNFVAKFEIEAIKGLEGLVIGGENELTMIGSTVSGDTFTGSAIVVVVDNGPSKK